MPEVIEKRFLLPTEIKDATARLPSPPNTIINFSFTLSANSGFSSRQVYSLMAFLGDVGGLWDALVIFGSALCFYNAKWRYHH